MFPGFGSQAKSAAKEEAGALGPWLWEVGLLNQASLHKAFIPLSPTTPSIRTCVKGLSFRDMPGPDFGVTRLATKPQESDLPKQEQLSKHEHLYPPSRGVPSLRPNKKHDAPNAPAPRQIGGGAVGPGEGQGRCRGGPRGQGGRQGHGGGQGGGFSNDPPMGAVARFEARPGQPFMSVCRGCLLFDMASPMHGLRPCLAGQDARAGLLAHLHYGELACAG